MKELVISVEGMVCNGCENRVENALMQINGVQKVYPDHNKGIVKVILKDDISKNIIKEKIEDLGFIVKEN